MLKRKLEIIEEYNKQHNEYTENPYWVIRDFERAPVENSYDYDCDGYSILQGGEEYCVIYNDDSEKEDLAELKYMIEQICDDEERIKSILEQLENIVDLEDKIDLINNEFEYTEPCECYCFKLYPLDSFIFLSRKSAENYLKAKKHNYTKKAHVYCKSNWAGNEFNELLKGTKEEIMLTIDQIFNNMKLINLPKEKCIKNSILGSIDNSNMKITPILDNAYANKKELTELEEKEVTKWVLWIVAAGIKFLEMQDVTKNDMDKLKKQIEENFKIALEIAEKMGSNNSFPFKENDIKC